MSESTTPPATDKTAPTDEASPVSQSAPTSLERPATVRYSGRIGGLDIARALAVFGMFYAHVAPGHSGEGFTGFLDQIPDGRSSILFAVVAGVSISILTGRNVPYQGQEARSARLRIFGRSAALLVIAAPVALLGTPIAIILAYYAAWFVAAMPFARWGSARLFKLALAVALLGPVLVQLIRWLEINLNFWSYGANAFVDEVFVSGTYPGLVYMAYVFAGMAIGRLDLTNRRFQWMLLLAGSAVSAIGFGLGFVLSRVFDPTSSDIAASAESMFSSSAGLAESSGGNWVEPQTWHWQGQPLPDVQTWITVEPHSNTVFEALGSGGFAVALLAVCLLMGALARNVLYPLAAAGSMALTAYVSHIIAISFNPQWVGGTSWAPFVGLVVVTLVACTVWRRTFRRGPLEWVMWKVSTRAADL